MYRDRGTTDQFEELFSHPKLTVRRFRMVETELRNDLVELNGESLIVPLLGSVEVQEIATSQKFHLDAKDACYLPPGDKFSLRKIGDRSEVVWSTAPAEEGFAAYLRNFTDCKGRQTGKAEHASRR